MQLSKSTNIKASTTDVLEPTVDNVLDLIENKKIIFKNDVAYWSRGKSVLPKEYRACIEQTQYAHWINEWSCEQAEKLGDRAYYDYDGNTEVKASNMRISKSNKIVKASTNTNFKYADKVKIEDIYPSDRDITFFFTSDDVKYAKELFGDIEGLSGFSIEVSLPKDYSGNWQEALIYISPKTKDGNGGSSDSDWTDITFEISDADMKSLVNQSWKEYKKRGWDDSEVNASCGDVKSSKKLSANDKALQHIKAAIDILGKSGNKDDLTKDSIANLATVMFDLKSEA